MAGEKRFRTKLFGFKKADVNLYIEKILVEFDDKLREKDTEISALKAQQKDLKFKYEDIMQKVDQINEDRAKIAQVLISAQEKADTILDDARAQSFEEKKALEGLVEKEKEKLVDIKSELKGLKQEVISTLKKYEEQLDSLENSELNEEE
jgi:cell division initiation protein